MGLYATSVCAGILELADNIEKEAEREGDDDKLEFSTQLKSLIELESISDGENFDPCNPTHSEALDFLRSQLDVSSFH